MLRVKNRAEYQNPIMTVLKSFFNQGGSGGSSGQAMFSNLMGGGGEVGAEAGPTAGGGAPEAEPPYTEQFDETFTQRLEKVPGRYIHMNIFQYEKFNIKITIGEQSAFFVYLVPQSECNFQAAFSNSL